jgi:hypothetical protein
MKNIRDVVTGVLLTGLVALASGCVVAEPREGYFDRDHHRYYHEHGWHECGEHNESCR